MVGLTIAEAKIFSIVCRFAAWSAVDKNRGGEMQTAKDVAIEFIRSLPDDCTLDEITHRLYLRRKLESADKAIKEGRVHSFEEGGEIVESWFTSSGPIVS